MSSHLDMYTDIIKTSKYNVISNCRPKADSSKPLRALLFDSWFAPFKGVVANLALTDGTIRKGKFKNHYDKY